MKHRHQVLFLTRAGCCLCDDAKAELDSVKDELGLDIREIDIDTDPELTRDYGRSIPVVFVDDKLAFK
jgi:glutaredoxin